MFAAGTAVHRVDIPTRVPVCSTDAGITAPTPSPMRQQYAGVSNHAGSPRPIPDSVQSHAGLEEPLDLSVRSGTLATQQLAQPGAGASASRMGRRAVDNVARCVRESITAPSALQKAFEEYDRLRRQGEPVGTFLEFARRTGSCTPGIGKFGRMYRPEALGLPNKEGVRPTVSNVIREYYQLEANRTGGQTAVEFARSLALTGPELDKVARLSHRIERTIGSWGRDAPRPAVKRQHAEPASSPRQMTRWATEGLLRQLRCAIAEPIALLEDLQGYHALRRQPGEVGTFRDYVQGKRPVNPGLASFMRSYRPELMGLPQVEGRRPMPAEILREHYTIHANRTGDGTAVDLARSLGMTGTELEEVARISERMDRGYRLRRSREMPLRAQAGPPGATTTG